MDYGSILQETSIWLVNTGVLDEERQNTSHFYTPTSVNLCHLIYTIPILHVYLVQPALRLGLSQNLPTHTAKTPHSY
jgi:hypothetical protein